MDILQKATIGNKELRIWQHESRESPREWDNLGTMVCWHNRYTLGDKHNFETPQKFSKWLKTNKVVILSVYMYDHSGIVLSTNRNYPFDDQWDAGQVGYIYVTHEKIKEEYSVTKIGKTIIDAVLRTLRQEIKTYNQFLNGDVYGFTVIEKSTCDKCKCEQETVLYCVGGFYGSDFKENGLLKHAGTEWKDAVLEDV